jgi:trehalose 6-phosphate synthase
MEATNGTSRGSSENSAPLVLVSNRGPVTFDVDGSFTRGTGGLVTALTGLASHRDAVWIASAMTDGDVAKAQESKGRPFEVHTPDGGEYQVRLVVSDSEAYDRFYNVVANPMLWFIQHYLWDLSNAPDIRANEVQAYDDGYKVVNADLAAAVIEQIEGEDEPVVMVHDYHLYTLPGVVREARPDVFLHHFIHIPWTQPDAWRVLPKRMRNEIYEGVLANDIVGFHTRSYRWNFLQCCRDLLDLEVDFERGVVHHDDGRETWVRAYPLPIDYEATRKVARSDRTREFEREIERRRRDHIILRVDRADLSKNVLRGFTAFDQFLEEHPEFHERVTFIAQLMPSRMDVPEYQEYLERIEALVAIVNHRHGTPDWMPIQLKLRDDLEEAVAAYKHYDVMIVNAMFDGMNLVAKEGPLVNERHGVSILSENTGAHEELGEFALSVNPFDIKETADSIFTALTMSPEERERRSLGLKAAVTVRDPGDWIDDQLADIRAKAAAMAGGG